MKKQKLIAALPAVLFAALLIAVFAVMGSLPYDRPSTSATNTFGNLSKMYKVFPQSLQSKVCKNFGIINQRQMEQFLSVLTKFRNVCAHGERLFTYQTIDNISDLPLHRKMSIPMNGIQYQYGKNDLFAVVIAFRYLIPNKDFLVFKRKFAALIDHTSKKLVHIDNEELLNKMGFPPNWKNIPRYRLTS